MIQTINSHYIIIAASVIIIFSYLFNVASRKTNIPSVLMLMLTGIAINFFAEIKSENLMKVLEILGTVGLIMIVLEAALDLKLTLEKRGILIKALVVSVALLLATSGFVTVIFYYLLEMQFYSSLLYAVPLSVMSSAIVIPSVGMLSEEKKEFMIFEASFSDIFGIMFFYFLVDLKNEESVGNIFREVSFNILGTVVISLLLSYALVIVFQKIRSNIKLFLLVSSLLLLYSSGKLMHMSSLVTILTFGLLLNNPEIFFRGRLQELLNPPVFSQIVGNFRMITMETAFVVRTFFFVIFGMSVVLSDLYNPMVFIVSTLILVGTYAIRFGGIRLVNGKEVWPETFITPRGLITILLFYAIPPEFIDPAFHNGILLMIILATSLIMTFGLIKYRKSVYTQYRQEGTHPDDQEYLEGEEVTHQEEEV